jgi:MoaA/NifB/PqqE/SkfB family radical SAM enzyme
MLGVMPHSGQGGIVWVPVGGACNSRCATCEERDVPEIPADGVRAAAEEARPAVLVLTGPGEPTLRRDLDALVHAARRGGAGHVAMVTNGRAFAYPGVAGAIASLRFSHIVVSLLHPDSEVHDRLTCVPGAHEQAIAGLKHIAQAARTQGTAIGLRTAPHEESMDSLGYLAEIARRAGASWLWVDTGESGSKLDFSGLEKAGLPVVIGTDVEDVLSHVPWERRSRDGAVQARLHPDEKAVSIVVRTGCRNACNFCTTRIIQETNLAPWPLDDLEMFHDSLKEASDNDYKSLRFVAVEPLEHPDIPDLISLASDLGFESIEAWTSGRALADAGWADRLKEAGLTRVDLPLFGPNSFVHDDVAHVKGSFDETVAGLNEAMPRFHVIWHLVVVKQNMGTLGDTVQMGRELGIGDPSSVLIPAPSSVDPAVYEQYAMRMSDVAYAVAGLGGEMANLLLSRGVANQIPPCILLKAEGIDMRHLGSLPPPVMDWVREGSLDEPGAALKLRSPCPVRDDCAARSRCPGFHTLYASVFGMEEFSPIAKE